MAERCIDCFKNKKRIYFNFDKIREEAKKLAITNEETYAIFKTGKVYGFTTYNEARNAGYNICEVVSMY